MSNFKNTFGEPTPKKKIIKPRNVSNLEAILNRALKRDKLDFETQSLLSRDVL